MRTRPLVIGVALVAGAASHAAAGDPVFLERYVDSQADGALSVAIADMDGDGDQDIVAAHSSADAIVWYENLGGAPLQFARYDVLVGADGARVVAVGDMDGDGDRDIVAASTLDDTIAWFASDGLETPAFTRYVISTDSDLPFRLALADLDDDGDLDVVSASSNDDTVSWLENDGARVPGFTRRVIAVADRLADVAVADLDLDGHVDVVVLASDAPLLWYRNNGAAPPEFTMQTVAAKTTYFTYALRAVDLDGDADPDLIAGLHGAIAWYEHDGKSPPAFTQHLLGYSQYGARSLATADLDDDRDLDVLSLETDSQELAWYERLGGATPAFLRHVLSVAVVGGASVASSDLDDDGDADVVAAAGVEGRISWFENGARQQSPSQSLHVPGEYPTIQAAIIAAPPWAEVVVADGVHSGPGNSDISFKGKQITVRSSGGPRRCTIDCGHQGRAFLFNRFEGPTSVLDGFSIINGQGPGGGFPISPVGGGAIFASQSSPIIRHCIFRDNSTTPGGGYGGAILISYGAPSIEDCLFKSNSAAWAGALGLDSTQNVQVRRCRFIANQAGAGGAIYLNYFSRASLRDCVITGNSANDGGALALTFAYGLSMTNTLVAENQALSGAAVLTMTESYFSAINCTITGNIAPAGQPSFYLDGIASLALGNTIVWQNSTPLYSSHYGPPGCGFCYIPTSYSIIEGGWAGEGVINADPRFVDAGQGDYRLAPGSPAIDAGRNASLPPDVEFDVAGAPRFADDPQTPDTGLGVPPIVDMGAYEFQPEPGAPGDLDGDGAVNEPDLDILLASWSIPPATPGCGGAPGPCPADLNHDGVVDSLDLGVLLSHWTL